MLINPAGSVACPADTASGTFCTFPGAFAERAGGFVGERFHRDVINKVRTDGQPLLFAFAVRTYTGTIAEGTFAIAYVGADRAGGFIVPGCPLFKSRATESGNDGK